ncbi:MAG TPA: hypothetical protein VEI97_11255, partial [bacterium]|nr:hypothetical protein [bacterium]
RSTMGANNDGWTGYSVLHQGQTARGTLMFDTASLEAVTTVTGDFSLDVAILATYNDPRGGTTPTEKKRNRLPSSDGNPDSFFYDMPRGTCPVTLCNAPTQNWTEGAATSSFSCTVGDWTGSITDGSHGTVSVCIPGVLGDSSVSVDIQSPVSGTGTPGDPYVFSGDLATTGATAGTYQGCFQYRLHESATTPVALDCDLAPVSKEEPKGNYSGHFVVIVSL